MAIDSEIKRRSVQAYLSGSLRPTSDGNIEAVDRAMVAGYYALTVAEVPASRVHLDRRSYSYWILNEL